jgi:ATP-dependent Clp protease adaptor protein ClpS
VTTATPVTEVLPVDDVDTAADLPWVSIVWNDPVNLMSYVTYVFQTLLGHPKAKAEKLMMDVHRRGRATVSHGTRDEMEIVATKLQSAGLWATIAQDK